MSAGSLEIIGAGVLDALSAEARRAPRLRKNYNLHPADLSACHRFFNAVEPGTYIRPHRHLHPEKDETLLVVRGRLGVLAFDEGGAVTAAHILTPGGALAANIPHGEYHAAISLQSGTVFFEAKAGPYLPLSDEEKGPFSPEEGSPEAAGYLERLAGFFR